MHFYYAIPYYLANLLPKRSANKTCGFVFLGNGVVAELFWHDTTTRRFSRFPFSAFCTGGAQRQRFEFKKGNFKCEKNRDRQLIERH
jgi:hypothetical protein